MSKELVFRFFLEARTVKHARTKAGVDAGNKLEQHKYRLRLCAVGNDRENRTKKQEVKNQTGLKPAWNANLQTRSVKNQ